MNLTEELAFWRDLGINLLTDGQLDARMPKTNKSAREVLAGLSKAMPEVAQQEHRDPHLSALRC